MKIWEQVHQLEQDLLKVRSDEDKIRGFLIVNFCSYEGNNSNSDFHVWDSVEDFNEVDTYSAILKVFFHLSNIIKNKK